MSIQKISIDHHYSYEIKTINKLQWENILRFFSDATLYQTWSYGAVRWGLRNLSHLTLYKDNQLVAAAQLRVIRLPFISCGIAYIANGPMWKIRNNFHNPEIFQKMLCALRQEYVERKGLFLRIIPNEIESENSEIKYVFKSEKFIKDLTIAPYRTLLIDLSPGLVELMANLKKKWRKSLRNAQQISIEIEDGTSLELFQKFKQLYDQMHTRKKFIEFYSIDDFEKIQENLPEDFKLRILVANFEKKPVSAIIWSEIGETPIIIFSATGDQGLKLNSSYFVRWSMLERLIERGYLLLDQGGIDPENNSAGYHYKVGFGGQDVKHIGTFWICKNPLSFIVVKISEFSRRIVRNFFNYFPGFKVLSL